MSDLPQGACCDECGQPVAWVYEGNSSLVMLCDNHGPDPMMVPRGWRYLVYDVPGDCDDCNGWHPRGECPLDSVFVQDVRRWIGDGHEMFTSGDIEAAAHALGTLGPAPTLTPFSRRRARQVAGYLMRLRRETSPNERALPRTDAGNETPPNAATEETS